MGYGLPIPPMVSTPRRFPSWLPTSPGPEPFGDPGARQRASPERKMWGWALGVVENTCLRNDGLMMENVFGVPTWVGTLKDGYDNPMVPT